MQDDPLDAQRDRALDVRGPQGATIVHTHLSRRQDLIGVTRDDLEDMLELDGMSAAFAGIGVFLLSGASWLIVENWLDADGFEMNALMGFCLSASLFGGIFLLAGLFFHNKKRGRIKKIFSQTD